MSNTYDYISQAEQAALDTNPTDPTGHRDLPFIGTYKQTHRLKAYCKVIVAGHDVTNKLDPYLLSIRIRDGDPAIGDIELDDRDGHLPIPPQHSQLEVWLGWKSEMMVKVFTGMIMDLEHGFGRKSGGRRMWIEARWDLTGKMKQPMQNNLGDGTPQGKKIGTLKSLKEFISTIALPAGVTKLEVHPIFERIKRDYWEQNNKSFVQQMRELAAEFNGEFRVSADGIATFTKTGEKADGSNTKTIEAKWGDNLIGWRVKPWTSRGAWGGTRQQWFDHAAANWKQVLSDINSPTPWGGATAKYLMPAPAPNKLVAGQHNDAVAEGNNYQGKGRIIINGEPTAEWMGYVNLTGARPGVDGIWVIDCAEHLYSRQGYITVLEVRPFAAAGLPTNTTLAAGTTSIAEAYKTAESLAVDAGINSISNPLEPTVDESQQIHSGINY